jgi:hypothetical protein
LAVAVTLATPEASVAARVADKFALAPVAGAANRTTAPITGCPAASFTVAWSGFGNAVVTVADCGTAPVAVMLAGVVAVFVNQKVAVTGVPEASTLAVTV